LTLGLSASFTETQTPGELNTDTGIEAGRATATFFGITPQISLRLTPLTSADTSYSYGSSSVSGGVETITQQTQLNVKHEVTPVDTATFGYRFSLFESDGTSSTSSHAVLLGWTRRLSERTSVTLRAGPRITEGEVNPDVLASIEHQFEIARVTLAYSQSETTVVGRAGAVKTEGVSASVAFEPLRSVGVMLTGSVRKTSGEGGRSFADTTVYGITALVSYQINRWLTVRASYRGLLQEQDSTSLEHSVLSIGVELNYPSRVY